jgi:hypothetical protein
MRKIVSSFFIAGLTAALVLTVSTFQGQVAEAAVTSWQQSVTITPRWNTDFSSDTFKQTIRNIASAKANMVTLVVPWCQDNNSSSDILDCPMTPTSEALTAGINYAHSQGLKVVLTVHPETYTGGWRAYISPNDRNRWYSQYATRLNNLATLAQSTGVEGIVIGAEMISTATYTSNPDNTQRWQNMIAQVRQRYSGFLTYSANWGGDNFTEEFPHIGFWSQLDYVGISGYFPLSTGEGSPSVQSLESSWARWRDTKIKPMNQQTGKPILFTEIGYKSVQGAHYEPWNSNRGGGYDGEEQRKLYQALFEFWNNEPYIAGVHLWDWSSDPNYGGQGNIDYTTHGKPAEQTMKDWFSGAAGTTPPPPPTGTTTPPGGDTGGGTTVPSNTSFSITGTVSPAQPIVNQSSTITAAVSAKGAVTNAVVDLEVYDASNNKIFQKFFEGQNLNQTPINLNVPWTPGTTGTYTLKGGIFNNTWATNYYWNDSILKMTVGNQTTPPPPPPPPPDNGGGTTTPPNNPPPTGSFNTNVWWPTDGASVMGIQPLKYNVDGIDASQYTGYWQVDGDRLNEMQTSTVDYPHKETQVDFTGWNWKGAGPYVINFVSKNSSGATISSKAINLFVR